MPDELPKQVNPWIKIWIAPKETMRFLLKTNPFRVIIWLAVLSGILSSLIWFETIIHEYPHQTALRAKLFMLMIVIVGIVLALFHLYFGSWLYQLTGSWLGGKGNFVEVKCAVGWSNYPFIIAHLFLLAKVYVEVHPIVTLVLAVCDLIIFTWGLVIFMNMLGEAHKFSAWKALGAVILAFLLIFIAVLLVSLIVPLLSPLFVS